MIDKKFLKLSPYEYLKACHEGVYCRDKGHDLRGVSVITYRQGLYYSSIENNGLLHVDILRDIERDIFDPIVSGTYFNDGVPEHVYIFMNRESVDIHFPDNGKMSTVQLKLILDFIKDVSTYNSEVQENERLLIWFESWNGIDIPSVYFIDDMDREAFSSLLEHVSTPEELEKGIPLEVLELERVVGKVPTEEEIEKTKKDFFDSSKRI